MITIEPGPRDRLTQAGLQLGPLTVSFQRFQRPNAGIISDAPSSLGALPVGEGNGEWLLPVADEEAFWIGVNAELAIELAVNAQTEGDGALDVLSGRRWSMRAPQTVALAAFAIIAGIRRHDGTSWALTRAPHGDAPACEAIGLFARDRRLRKLGSVRLVDYASFAERTGRAPPAALDPHAGYKGFRLP